MRNAAYHIFFILIISFGVAMGESTQSNELLKSIPDLSYEATKLLPSILLSPEDSRIDQLARGKSTPFLVKSEGKISFVIILNPKHEIGYLWWKKPSRIKLTSKRWEELKAGANLVDHEKKFFDMLK